MTHFLLVYERTAGRLREITQFDDGHEALHERFNRERTTDRDPDVEIVVLTADSLDSLRRTHARYFKSPSELLNSMLAESGG